MRFQLTIISSTDQLRTVLITLQLTEIIFNLTLGDYQIVQINVNPLLHVNHSLGIMITPLIAILIQISLLNSK